MSKITHKEAQEIVVNWTSGKIKDDTERAEANLKLNQYFIQQEKKDKLLDKYREFMKNEKHPDSENYELIDEIKELESELYEK